MVQQFERAANRRRRRRRHRGCNLRTTSKMSPMSGRDCPSFASLEDIACVGDKHRQQRVWGGEDLLRRCGGRRKSKENVDAK